MMIHNSRKKELQILYIALKGNISIFEATKMLNSTIRSIKESIIILNSLIEIDYRCPNFIEISSQNIITVNSRFTEEGLKFFYKIKYLYLAESNELKILTSLLIHDEVCIDDFLNELFISKSYLLRIIKKMNASLSDFGLAVLPTPGGYTISGDEIVIRLLSFLIFADSNHLKAEIPELVVPNSAFSPLATTLSTSQKAVFSSLLASTISRINLHKSLDDELTPEHRELFTALKNNFDVTIFCNSDDPFLEPLFENETELLFLNYLIRVLGSDIIPAKDKLFLMAALHESDNRYLTLSTKLCREIEEPCGVKFSQHDKLYLTYFLTISLSLHALFGEKIFYLYKYIPDIPNFQIPINNSVATTLTDTVERFAETEDLCFLNNEHVKQIFINLIATTIAIKSEKKLTICIQLSKDFYSAKIVKDLILSVFNADKLLFSPDILDADLIITDKFDQDYLGIPTYFFDSLQNQGQWTGLLGQIQTIMMNDIFAMSSVQLSDLLKMESVGEK